MNKLEFNNSLIEKADLIKVEISQKQADNFYKYMELLLEWNKKMNLTAITEPEEVILKHFVDSLTIIPYLNEENTILDVGTGAGFPGIPLKILEEDKKFTLLDSLNKRIIFLQNVIDELNLKNIQAVHGRAEEYIREKREHYDIATSRAVAKLNVLLEYMIPFVKVGGRCICMKSFEIDEELKDAEKAIEILDDMGAEVIITVCPSCYKVFKETAKNQKVIAYWDLMKNLIGIPETARGIGTGSDVVFNIHDSCVTRDETSHHESVRWVLDELGYNWTEIERNGKNTRCCGVGGMVCSSNPELYERVYTRRANDFDQHNIVTYCGSCRGTMQAAGKDAVHILDLLFGQKYTKDQESVRGYQTEQEMWEKRLETKERLNHLR